MILPSGIGVLASSFQSVFVPPSIANLKLWVRPESLSALSDNDPVAHWDDESGNNNDFDQGSAALKPTYKTNQLNGHAGVDFDGTSDFMLAPLLTTNTAFTMFLVVKWDSAGVTQSCFKVGEAFGYAFLQISGNRNLLHRAVASCDDGAVSAGTAEVWSAVHTDAPLSKMFVNGSGVTITNSTAAVIAPDAVTYLGQFGVGGPLYFDGQVYEILSYDVALSDADRVLVENYLKTKYGL